MKAVVVDARAAAPNGTSAWPLLDAQLPDPVPLAHDLLVRVEAAAVNPIDLRMLRARPAADGAPRVLGWDAAGVVEAVGASVDGFEPGDAVFYAGSLSRPGSFAELQLVDHRLVGPKPARLSFAEAAALPLSSLAAWEALFDRIRLVPGSCGVRPPPATLLVLGGAGGVGSMAVQLAARRTSAFVVATASRPESRKHCLEMGAAEVIDHLEPLKPQLQALGLRQLDAVVCLADPARVFAQLAELVAPHGQICALVEASADLPMNLLRAKSASFVWEGMFTRSLFQTQDMACQGAILREVARLVDAGVLKTTRRVDAGPLDAARLSAAFARVATGHTVGKVVLTRAGPDEAPGP